jgi:hypothetical protein
VRKTPIFATNDKISNQHAAIGQQIWASINVYVRLVINHRVKNGSSIDKIFAVALGIYKNIYSIEYM